jgi:ERF superfamily
MKSHPAELPDLSNRSQFIGGSDARIIMGQDDAALLRLGPVCRLGDSANPHRMGAALTYARRYTLFALVGIAGEDDLDAPDLGGAHQRPALGVGDGSKRGPGATSPYRPQGNGKRPRPPMLDAKSSAMLRDRLVGEIASIPSAEHGAEWAYKALPARTPDWYSSPSSFAYPRSRVGRTRVRTGYNHRFRVRTIPTTPRKLPRRPASRPARPAVPSVNQEGLAPAGSIRAS